MSEPLGPVFITAREIYDQGVRVASAVEKVSVQIVDVLKGHADHEDRLRRLESGRWPLPALAVLVSLAALALAYFRP